MFQQKGYRLYKPVTVNHSDFNTLKVICQECLDPSRHARLKKKFQPGKPMPPSWDRTKLGPKSGSDQLFNLGTPVHHPFLDGIFHYKPTILGIPHDYGNHHMTNYKTLHNDPEMFDMLQMYNPEPPYSPHRRKHAQTSEDFKIYNLHTPRPSIYRSESIFIGPSRNFNIAMEKKNTFFLMGKIANYHCFHISLFD